MNVEPYIYTRTFPTGMNMIPAYFMIPSLINSLLIPRVQ